MSLLHVAAQQYGALCDCCPASKLAAAPHIAPRTPCFASKPTKIPSIEGKNNKNISCPLDSWPTQRINFTKIYVTFAIIYVKRSAPQSLVIVIVIVNVFVIVNVVPINKFESTHARKTAQKFNIVEFSRDSAIKTQAFMAFAAQKFNIVEFSRDSAIKMQAFMAFAAQKFNIVEFSRDSAIKTQAFMAFAAQKFAFSLA